MAKGFSLAGAVAEPHARYETDSASPYLSPGGSEADLSKVWEGQTFPPEAMTSRDGARLRVVYRGRRGRGAGPDFRDAIIAAPYGLLEGDVELHMRAGDFRRHRHHLDSAYDGVVLHLVLEHDGETETVLNNGRRVPIVALADWLRARAGQMERWLERAPLWQEPCRDSLTRFGRGEVTRTLDRLGDMRFRAVTAAFTKRLAGGEAANEIAWRGLLEALGYGGERERFRALAEAAPWYLLGQQLSAGTYEDRRREALRALLEVDRGSSTRPSSLRPGNRFDKRVQAAAVYAARWTEGIVQVFQPLLSLDGGNAARELVRSLMVPGVVGRGRAVEMAANAMLPLLAAIEGGLFERPAERVYALLPLPARYGSVRHLHEAVGNDARGTWKREKEQDRGIGVNARRQQGMLYLLRQYCTQGGCGRCPLS